MVSHNLAKMEKIEQKKVFATHAEADSHVNEVKARHLDQKEKQKSELREAIGEATERELFDNQERSSKSSHTIRWQPGQYERIFSKA